MHVIEPMMGAVSNGFGGVLAMKTENYRLNMRFVTGFIGFAAIKKNNERSITRLQMRFDSRALRWITCAQVARVNGEVSTVYLN